MAKSSNVSSGGMLTWLGLALIILLDQFSMNIYRDQAQGYTASELAIPLAYTAIGRNWVEQVHPDMRMFFALPLSHSENIHDQAVAKNMDPSDDCVDSHFVTVREHGRFPGRNKCHGRDSNEKEQNYLDDGGVF